MSLTYTWKVKNIKTATEQGREGVIVQTYWEKTGTDADGNSGTFIGATPFSAANTPDEEFVNLENLTEETVLNWIKAVVVDQYEQHVNTQIARKIQESKGMHDHTPMPWAPEAPMPPKPGDPVANTETFGVNAPPR